MYHSWWFIACLALLALNILACTMERYPQIMKGMKKPNALLEDKPEAGFNEVARIRYNLPRERVETRLADLAGKWFSASPVITRTEAATHLFYEKGRYTRRC